MQLTELYDIETKGKNTNMLDNGTNLYWPATKSDALNTFHHILLLNAENMRTNNSKTKMVCAT